MMPHRIYFTRLSTHTMTRKRRVPKKNLKQKVEKPPITNIKSPSSHFPRYISAEVFFLNIEKSGLGGGGLIPLIESLLL